MLVEVLFTLHQVVTLYSPDIQTDPRESVLNKCRADSLKIHVTLFDISNKLQ